MRESTSETERKDLAQRRARREAKQPYATELDDREIEQALPENSPEQSERRRRPRRPGAAV